MGKGVSRKAIKKLPKKGGCQVKNSLLGNYYEKVIYLN